MTSELPRYESDAAYRAVVEDQTELIGRFRPDGTVLLVNDAYCRFFGCTREDVIGHRWQPRAAAADVPMIEAELKTLGPDNPVVVIENRVHAAGGEMRWCQFVNRGFFGSGGELVEIQCVGRDITALKRAEEALRRERDFAEGLIRTAQVIVLVLDPSGRIRRANPHFGTVTGFDVQDVEGMDWFDNFVPGSERNSSVSLFRVALSNGPARRTVHRILTRSGGVRDIEWNNQTLKGSDGEVLGLLCIGQDVTDQHRSMEALRNAEEKYRRLFETMTQGAFLQRSDGKLVDVNPAALEIFGLTRDEFLQRNSLSAQWDVIREDGSPVPGTEHPSMVALRTGRPVRDATLGVVNARSRRRLWLVINAQPEFLPGEDLPHQVFVTLHDITARWEADQALALAKRQLKGLASQVITLQETERSRLSRELHDEIGQSLTALKLAVDRARREADSSTPMPALVDAAAIADDLIEATRDISRRLRPPQLDELGLAPAVRWHLDRLGAPLPIHLRDRVGDARFPLEVELSAFRIVQEAVSNVLRHARAIEAWVALEHEPGRLEVSIRDDGAGFDMGSLEQPTAAAGAPLGLIGMRERVAALDGQFSVRSKPGAGTEVIASFPLPEPRP